MGAHDVIVSPERRFAREVRTLTGRQADLVLEIVGAATLRESLHAVRPGGRVVVLGNVEGQEVSIPPAYLILKEWSARGKGEAVSTPAWSFATKACGSPSSSAQWISGVDGAFGRFFKA